MAPLRICLLGRGMVAGNSARCFEIMVEDLRSLLLEFVEAVQETTENSRKLAYAEQGYPGASASQAADKHVMRLEVVKRTEAKLGFVLLPRRSVVERSFAWAAGFRRLTRDYERLSKPWSGAIPWPLPSSCARQFGQIAPAKFIQGSSHARWGFLEIRAVLPVPKEYPRAKRESLRPKMVQIRRFSLRNRGQGA